MRIPKTTIYLLAYLFTIAIIACSFLLKIHLLTNVFFSGIRVLIIICATVLLTKYTLYMMIAPFFGLASQDNDVSDDEPLVSVLIPAWNEEVGLLDTIKTVLESTYRHIEIVVVNDGSTDRSHAMMQNFLIKYQRTFHGIEGHIPIFYYYQHNGGKGSALNTALALAHGELLVSLDADCVVTPGAIEAFVHAFRHPNVMAAVGNVKVGNTRTLIGVIQALEYTFGFYFKKCDSLLNTIYIIGGAAGAFRREVFQTIGGYSTHNITEDIELSVRIQKAGMKIVYVPDAIIITEGASSLWGLLKQRLRWKRGRFQTFWEHRSLFFSLRRQHNKLLTWIVLPLALFGDIQLGMEPLFLAVLYLFSFLSGDFSGFWSSIVIVVSMFLIQAWDSRTERQREHILLAPIGWVLFYVLTFVEFYALVKSLWLFLRGKELKWQRWQRSGATK